MDVMEGIIFGIPFGALLGVLAFLVYWINAFFVIYHLTRFGIGTHPKIIAFIFFLGSVILFSTIVGTYASIDVSGLIGRFNSEFIFDIPTPSY